MGDPINGLDPSGRQTCFYVDGVLDSCEEDTPVYQFNTTVTKYKASGDPNSIYSQFGRDRANLIHAGGMLLARQSISAKCQGGMDALKVDFDVLAIAASEADIRDGTTSAKSMASAYADAQLGAAAQAKYDKDYASYLQSHGLQHLTVAGYFAATGNTAAWTPLGGNTVYVNSSLFSTANLKLDQALLLHEMLHEAYGLDDGDVMKSIAAFDPGAGINPDVASEQTTKWMLNNCVNGKGNN